MSENTGFTKDITSYPQESSIKKLQSSIDFSVSAKNKLGSSNFLDDEDTLLNPLSDKDFNLAN